MSCHVLQAVLHLTTCSTQHVVGSQAWFCPGQAAILILWVRQDSLGTLRANYFIGHPGSECCYASLSGYTLIHMLLHALLPPYTRLWVQAAAEHLGPPTAWSILDSKRVNGCLTVQESFQHPASSSELSCSLTFEADGSISVQVSSLG